MKRTATLVAGLLLVTGTVFAQGTLDFSGTQIKAKTTVLTSAKTGNFNDDSNGDTDMVLQVKFKLDDKTTATVKYNTDDENDTYDSIAELLVKRVDGKVEAQFDAELSLSGVNNDLEKVDTPFLREDQDSNKTYIKYKYTDKIAFTAYPFNMGMANGSEFDEDGQFTEIPGLVVNYGTAYAGLGIDAINVTENSKNKIYNVVGLKAGYSTEIAGAKLTAKYSGAFFDEKKLLSKKVVNTNALNSATNGKLGAVTNDINVQASYQIAKLALEAEFGLNTLVDGFEIAGEKVESGTGIFVKGTYSMTDALAPYASVAMTTDGYFADEDMSDDYAKTKTGGITTVKAGANYKLASNLTVGAEARLRNAGEKIYTDADGDKTKSEMRVQTSVTYKF